MKSLLTFLVTVAALESALSQGYFAFSNYYRDWQAPVFDTDCQTKLQGSNFVAQAYVGFTPDSLTATGPVVPFRIGPLAGYIGLTVVEVPGTTLPRQTVYVQMRAWEARAGGSFEAAVLANGKYGVSNIATAEAVVNDPPPGPMTSPLESFCLIPEPRVWLLIAWAGLLWAAGALLRSIGPSGLGAKSARARPSPVCSTSRFSSKRG